MGVHNLRTSLDNNNLSEIYANLETFIKRRGIKSVGIDVPSLAYQYLHSKESPLFTRFLQLIIQLRSLSVRTICVFDTRPLNHKKDAIYLRQKRTARNKVKVDKI